MTLLNIASVRQCTDTEGPGKRFALWCQGCLNRCPGCCNPEMQALVQRHIVAVKDLEEMIQRAVEMYAIEGVSFIGGEPFLQAKGLSELAEWCHQHNLSVLVFSGYTKEELIEKQMDGTDRLLDNTDILVDGRYDEKQPDYDRAWVGSQNQTVHYLTDFYAKGTEFQATRAMDILITDDSVLINGWPYDDTISS